MRKYLTELHWNPFWHLLMLIVGIVGIIGAATASPFTGESVATGIFSGFLVGLAIEGLTNIVDLKIGRIERKDN